MKICVIGCGSIAEVHGKCITAVSSNVIAGAADIIFDRAFVFTRKYGGRAYTNWLEMVYELQPDVVHICTPHYTHEEIASKLLNIGINVFCEKPPVTNYEQFEHLTDTYKIARKKNTRMAVCFQNRLNPETEFVKEQIEKGELGKVIGARGFVTWKRTEDYYNDGKWRGIKKEAGGGALINQGIHTLDLINYFIDSKAVLADAMMDNFHLKGKVDVEDTLCAYIEYENGAKAIFYVTTSYVTDSAPIIEIICEKAAVFIMGNKVIIRHDNAEEQTKFFSHKTGFGKSYWGAGHENAISTFYDCITNDRKFILDYENTYDILKIMLDIYK